MSVFLEKFLLYYYTFSHMVEITTPASHFRLVPVSFSCTYKSLASYFLIMTIPSCFSLQGVLLVSMEPKEGNKAHQGGKVLPSDPVSWKCE